MTDGKLTIRNGRHRVNGATPAALPPQNLEAERGVLGSIAFDNTTLDVVQAILKPANFYLESHRLIYEAILRLRDRGLPFDVLTIGQELQQDNRLEDAGGYSYLQEVIESVPYAAHAKFYAEQVREPALRRDAMHAAGDLIAAAYDRSADLTEAVNAAEARLHALIESKVTGQAATAVECGLEYLARLDSPQKAGIPTGFDALDALVGGLKPGQLVIIAARPSVGKTAFAGSMVLTMAKAGTPVFFVSMEQMRVELMERFVCAETGFPTSLLQAPKIRRENRQTIEEAVNALTLLPFTVMEGLPRKVSEVAAQARLQHRRANIRLVVCDYLQLFSAEDRTIHREAQVAEISRSLKALAVSLGIPVVALAQLNRGVEIRENKRPRLSDLRESGAIEQDADLVMFIDRPRTYNPQADEAEASLIVAKNRNGQTGDVKLHWDGPRMRFINSAASDFGHQY